MLLAYVILAIAAVVLGAFVVFLAIYATPVVIAVASFAAVVWAMARVLPE